MSHWSDKNVRVGAYHHLAAEHHYGRRWYQESGDNLRAYAERRRLDPNRVIDVLAILSPRVSVARNVALATAYLETRAIDGVMRSRVVALSRYEQDGVVRGPKVSAFAAALKGEDAIVVDSWMLRLFEESPTVPGLKRCRRAIASVAGKLGWPSAETQAALWCGVRSAYGFNDSYSPIKVM